MPAVDIRQLGSSGGAVTAFCQDFLRDPELYPPDVFPDDPVAEGELRVDGGGALVLDDLFVARPRELLFVLDASCSMNGEPWVLAKKTVLRALAEMTRDDRFNVVTFSNASSSLFDAPAAVTSETLAAAKRWLETAYDGGGTEMEAGIIRSLDMPGDPRRLRLVLFLTDGYIGNDDEMFGIVRAHLGRSRLFSLGIGSSPNRYLLEGLAEMGRGGATRSLRFDIGDHASGGTT